MYKGTLSSGVEIAVASLVETSAKCWCSNLELQFRKKVLNKRKLENDMPVSCGLTVTGPNCSNAYVFRSKHYQK